MYVIRTEVIGRCFRQDVCISPFKQNGAVCNVTGIYILP